VAPSDYTFVAGDNGVHTFTNGVTLVTAGSQSITATDTNTSGINGSASLTVAAAAAAHFTVAALASSTAGNPFLVTVTAQDVFGNTATGYTGTVHFSSSDGQASLPSNSTLSGGVGTFIATFKSLGSQALTATDTASSSITGSAAVMVTAGAVTHFGVSAPATVTAGNAFTITVSALDAFGNTVTSYAGKVHFTSSDSTASLPSDSTLTNGAGTFSATFDAAGSQTLTAMDTVSGSISGSAAVAVSAAAATHFSVVTPSASTAGNGFLVSVTALDAFNNTATGYTGTVHFTSTDGQTSLPANSTLSNGSGVFVATLKTAGSQTLTLADVNAGSITGVSGAIAVSAAAASHFSVVAPASAAAGSAFSASVTALDAFGNTASSYAGTVHFTSSDAAAVLPPNSTLTNGAGSVNVTLKTTGSQFVTATDTAASSITGVSGTISVVGFAVSSFATTSTGFTVTFTQPFNASVLNLYDAASANYGAADVVLAGQLTANNPVRGSLVIDPTDTTITFVKTGGVLTPDTYTVTLVSGASAFKSSGGVALDGNNSGVPGTNYTTTFTVSASSAVVVSVPSFARGPDAGHNINVPNTTTGGIPLKLSNGNGVTDVTLTLNYDPTLLNVSGAAVNPALSGATLTLSGASTPGHAVLVFHSPTALTSGAATLGGIVAQVPNNAPYRNKAVLDLSNTQINSGSIAAVPQDAMQAVAYFGDASGNGTFSGLDGSLISRVAAKLDSGFAAYRLLDPVIVADINGNGRIDSNDASQLAQFLVNNASVPAVPPIPSPAPALTFGGPDPTLSLPAHLTAQDGLVVVPVLLDHPHPDGSTGMTEASLALTYDPRLFRVSAADVHLGSIPASGMGWTLSTVVDPSTGEIGIRLYSTTPIAATASGSLVTIALHRLPGAATGTTAVQLVGSVQAGGQVIRTEVDDDQGAFTLTPAPTNTAPVGASVTISAAPETVTVPVDSPASAVEAVGAVAVVRSAEETTNPAVPVAAPVLVYVVPEETAAVFEFMAATASPLVENVAFPADAIPATMAPQEQATQPADRVFAELPTSGVDQPADSDQAALDAAFAGLVEATDGSSTARTLSWSVRKD
jgi:hypothetical protein